MFSPRPYSRHRSPPPTTLPLTNRRGSTSASSGGPGAVASSLRYVLDNPVRAFFLAIFSVLLLSLVLGVTKEGQRERSSGGRKVVARDWDGLAGPAGGMRNAGVSKGDTVLILTPMKNSIEHIWHFFHLLDTLTYPRHLLQIGVLVSDSTDRTYLRALELADERQYGRHSSSASQKRGRYSRITVLQKNFASPHADGGTNIGKDRHEFALQVSRRKLLANSRTWLLSSALVPEVDWVLWLDVDVVEYEKDLIQTLLGYGNETQADVVVPNCMWKTYNEMGSYDRNNWAETPESLALKTTLDPEDVLIEGYETHLKTFRSNMADLYPPTDATPRTMTLDGVGGCTTLVKADLHRKGAVFPSWVVDHQLETEGFAQLAKGLGGRLVGLPQYYVYHGLYG